MKANEPTCPTEEEIPALVDRAAVLEVEIAERETELKLIKKRLEMAALKEHADPLKDESREGRRVSLAGVRSKGAVTICSDSLIASFQQDSPKHKELLELLKDEEDPVTALKRFFNAPSKWESRFKDGQDFRKAAAEWLSSKIAPKFIAACRQVDKLGIAKNKITMAFSNN